jgi:hypothetical protein
MHSQSNFNPDELDGLECRQLAALLTAYFDGEANDFETEIARAHIQRCLRCAELLNSWNQTRYILRSTPPPSIPVGLFVRVLMACRLAAQGLAHRRAHNEPSYLEPSYSRQIPEELIEYRLGLHNFVRANSEESGIPLTAVPSALPPDSLMQSILERTTRAPQNSVSQNSIPGNIHDSRELTAIVADSVGVDLLAETASESGRGRRGFPRYARATRLVATYAVPAMLLWMMGGAGDMMTQNAPLTQQVAVSSITSTSTEATEKRRSAERPAKRQAVAQSAKTPFRTILRPRETSVDRSRASETKEVVTTPAARVTVLPESPVAGNKVVAQRVRNSEIREVVEERQEKARRDVVQERTLPPVGLARINPEDRPASIKAKAAPKLLTALPKATSERGQAVPVTMRVARRPVGTVRLLAPARLQVATVRSPGSTRSGVDGSERSDDAFEAGLDWSEGQDTSPDSDVLSGIGHIYVRETYGRLPTSGHEAE